MNETKHLEVQRRTEELCGQKIIHTCLGRAWSQVVMPNKSEGSYRFCHDFRRLNDCTETQSFPIPNINHMIDRLGSKRPQYVGTLDLKYGYFQVPLAEDSQQYTCFITFCGMFAYNRVPQGVKNAVSWFQSLMITIIFVSLIYKILEVYLDDVIVHDENKGFNQFLINLDLTFTRMELVRLIVNPDKTVLGVSQTEFVGHTIDGEGKHFSRKKLDVVLNIDLPIYGKGLKSFLGTAQWFADHVRDFSAKLKPLQEFVRDYEHTKNR